MVDSSRLGVYGGVYVGAPLVLGGVALPGVIGGVCLPGGVALPGVIGGVCLPGGVALPGVPGGLLLPVFGRPETGLGVGPGLRCG